MQKLTNQQAFDKALFGIRAQGYARSYINGRGCSYRGANSTKCAVGHCIPDELYTPELDSAGESTDWFSIVFRHGNHPAIWLLSDCNGNFIADMQDIHDTNLSDVTDDNGVSEFESSMKMLAEQYTLVYTPVNTTE